MPTLSKDLELPIIGGILTVDARRTDNHQNETEKWHISWEVTFRGDGPDSRYTSASATITPDIFPKFVEMFKRASEKLRQLEGINFDGSFSEFFSCGGFPMLGVSAENGKVTARFWLQSPRNKFFPSELQGRQLEESIAKLQQVPELANALMSSLESIVFGKLGVASN